MKSLKDYILESASDNETTNNQTYRKYIDKIIDITDKNEVTPLLDEIWNILTDAYKSLGGMKGCTKKKDLYKKDRMFSIIKDEDNSIIAVQIYRNFNEGKKMVYGGARKTTEGKLALQSIIIRDIENLNLHHFGEVSGAIEHYFKKHNGYPIPNEYVSSILNNYNITLAQDGFHYERIIAGDEEPTEKCMFGFVNEETYNKIKDGFLDYIGFRKLVNTEITTESKIFDYPSNIKWALQIISFISEFFEEGNLNELFEEMAKELKKAISILNSYSDKDSNIKYAIKNGNGLIKDMPIVKLQPITF